MTGIVDPNLFDAAQLDATLHLMFQVVLGHREQPVIHLVVLEALHVILNVICQEGRNTDRAVALRCLGWRDDVTSL